MSEPIVVGVALASQPQETGTRLQAFCQAFAASVGAEIVGRTVSSYDALLEELRDGKVDVGWLPPIVALRAERAGLVRPLAAPLRSGVCTYSTALFGRADGPVQRIGDLSRCRAAWVDRQSASGYLLVRAFLRSLGVDLASAFAHESFLGQHDAVVGAVLSGQADVGATFLHTDPASGAVRSAAWGRSKVHVIAQVGPIPSDVLACGKGLPLHAAATLRDTLVEGSSPALSEAAAALFVAEGFAACAQDHLTPLAQMLEYLEEGPAAFSLHPPPPES